MGFNEKGEIIRKSGPQRQAQTESQRPAPSKLALAIYDFFEKIAVGTFMILSTIFVILFLGSFVVLFDGNVEGLYGLIACILLVVIIFKFRSLLLDFLDKQSDEQFFDFMDKHSDKQYFGVIFILLALWNTIFFALVFWFLSQKVNSFVALFLTLLIAYILYIWGRKPEAF